MLVLTVPRLDCLKTVFQIANCKSEALLKMGALLQEFREELNCSGNSDSKTLRCFNHNPKKAHL